MDCQRASELFSEYIDGMLDDDMSLEVEKHIETCGDCRQEYQLLKSIIQECHSFEEKDLPDGFHDKLHERLVKENFGHGESRNRWFKMRRYYAAAAAAIVMVVSLGVAVNSGILDSNKKSASSVKEEVTGEAQPQIMMSAENASPAEAVPSAKDLDGGMEVSQAQDQAKMSSFYEALSYPVITINLSEEEYKKHYQNIAVTIEGYGGYLDTKEPAAYILPGDKLDAMMGKLKETFKLEDVSLGSQDITDRYNVLKNEVYYVEEETNSSEAESSKEDTSGEIARKKEELKKLDEMLQSVYIIINN